MLDTVLANSPLPFGFGAWYRHRLQRSRHPEMIANADRIFAAAADLAAARDATFHVVFLATPEECARGAHSLDLGSLTTPHRTLLPLCPDDPRIIARLKFPHDGHWSIAGHAWAADALYELLWDLPEPTGPAQVAEQVHLQ